MDQINKTVNIEIKADTSQLDKATKQSATNVEKIGDSADKTKGKLSTLGSAFRSIGDSLGGPFADIGNKFDDARNKADGFKTGITGVSSSLRPMGAIAGTVATGILAVGAAAVVAAAGLATIAISVANQVDAMNDLAAAANLSVERYNFLSTSMAQAGGNINQLISVSEQLSSKLAKQDEETGKLGESLKALGVSTKDANGNQKSAIQLTEDIILAADKATDKSKAQAEAVKLLGTQYFSLRASVIEAKDKQADLYRFMETTGANVTKELSDESGKFGDNIDKIGTALKGIGNSIATVVLPYVNKFLEKMVEAAELAAKIIKNFSSTETVESNRFKLRDLDTEIAQREANQNRITRRGSMASIGTGAGFAVPMTTEITRYSHLSDQELRDLRNRQARRLATMLDADAERFRKLTEGVSTEGAGTAGTGMPIIKTTSTTPTADEIKRKAEEEKRKAEEEKLKALEAAAKVDLARIARYDQAEQAAENAYQAEKKYASSILDQLNPMRTLDREIAQINANIILSEEQKAEAVALVSERWVKSQEEMKQSNEDTFNFMERVGMSAFKSLEDALSELATTGKLNFKSLTASIISDISRLIIQVNVIKPLFKMLEGFGWFGGESGKVTSSPGIKFANGAAFLNGKVTPFATGGIVNSPTLFPMATGIGLMGEAGPEAIMPLTRGANGKLGVQSVGGQASTVNITYGDIIVQGGQTNAETAAALQRTMIDTAQQIAKQTISNELRPGGLIYRR